MDRSMRVFFNTFPCSDFRSHGDLDKIAPLKLAQIFVESATHSDFLETLCPCKTIPALQYNSFLTDVNLKLFRVLLFRLVYESISRTFDVILTKDYWIHMETLNFINNAYKLIRFCANFKCNLIKI